MAAVAQQVDLITISVNDVEIQVPKGELVVESVKRLGLEIPIFCYHPRMKPVGMCRMCLVEVGQKQPDGTIRKFPKPQAACSLPASEGMAIYTDSEMVHRDRKGVLEFLLVNHPLDCPICDRGGECPLQNNTLFYGPSTSRFIELKRHAHKAFPLSEYVTLDLERCIQCGRCVRFTEEISGDSQLAFRFRGADMQPATFELNNFESKFSGNVIEICPVGALTSSKYRFRARPWDLETKPAICTLCSNGCNIWFDYRVNKMVRINGRTNEAVNEEWTCDKGKFGHETYNSDKRLTKPLIRNSQGLAPADWSEAYSAILRTFVGGGASVAVLGGAVNSNEDLWLLQRLFRRDFSSPNLDHRFEKHLLPYDQRVENKLGISRTQLGIAEIEDASSLLVFGSSLADEEPIVFLRVRKAWFKNGTKVVVAHHAPTDVDSFAHLVLRYKEGTAHLVAGCLLNLLVQSGKANVPAATAEALKALTPDGVSSETGVPAKDLVEAADLIAGSPIITTHELLNVANGPDALETIAGLSKVTGGKFAFMGLEANDEGALRLGLLPDTLPGNVKTPNTGLNTNEILEAAANGTIKALWLANVNPFSVHPDRDLVTRALESVDFLVVQGVIETEATAYASVVLPQAAPAESEGTFTNVEGRVQRFGHVLPTKGDAKPAWKIYNEISQRIKPQTPFFNPGEVLTALATEAPEYASVTVDGLNGEGSLL
jgi:NADH-quinone oxidoreductase subunit G